VLPIRRCPARPPDGLPLASPPGVTAPCTPMDSPRWLPPSCRIPPAPPPPRPPPGHPAHAPALALSLRGETSPPPACRNAFPRSGPRIAARPEQQRALRARPPRSHTPSVSPRADTPWSLVVGPNRPASRHSLRPACPRPSRCHPPACAQQPRPPPQRRAPPRRSLRARSARHPRRPASPQNRPTLHGEQSLAVHPAPTVTPLRCLSPPA